MKGRKKEMKSVIKQLIIIAFIILVVIAILSINVKSNKTSFADRPTEEVYINRGDTLWTIGRKYCGENEDVRDWISAVVKLNGMDTGNIYAGQVITVYTGVSE